MKNKSQKQLVLDYLWRGKKISARKAIAYFNIIRLSAIIYYLKRDGIEIETERKFNLNGKGQYVEYFLKNSFISEKQEEVDKYFI